MSKPSPQHTGVLTIDKPEDYTSHDIVAAIRRLSGIRRIGHTGTLDPFATGLLLVVVGPATRLIRFTHAWPKTYQATITFGATSTTDDNRGDITLTTTVTPPSLAEVTNALQKFIGTAPQRPPSVSAKKIGGRKLYEYARENTDPTVLARLTQQKESLVTIHSIDIESYEYPTLEITVTVGTGTYIRALARDLGEALKTGAYVTALRRTNIGPYSVAQAKKLNDITTENLPDLYQPAAGLVADLPALTVTKENVAQLFNGQAIGWGEVVPNETVALYDNHTLIGVGTYDKSLAQVRPTIMLPAP